MYIDKKINRVLSRFLNFLGTEGNPFGSATNFKSLDRTKNISHFVCFSIFFYKNNVHLLSQFSLCDNFVLLNVPLNELPSI